MARVPITDEVREQLREAIATEAVPDPIARYDVQAVAFDRGYDELVEFVASADASTYYEAVSQVTDGDPRGDRDRSGER